MLYTITAINGNEVTLDKQPPSTAYGNHNGLIVDAVSYTSINTILISDQMQEMFKLEKGSRIELFGTNPKQRDPMYLSNNRDSEKALRYNEGKTQWGLLHYASLEPMVRVLEYGAKKYTTPDAPGENNWKKPMDKRKILESTMRHLTRMLDGEEIDPESGLPHHAHASANLHFYSFHSKSNDSK